MSTERINLFRSDWETPQEVAADLRAAANEVEKRGGENFFIIAVDQNGKDFDPLEHGFDLNEFFIDSLD